MWKMGVWGVLWGESGSDTSQEKSWISTNAPWSSSRDSPYEGICHMVAQYRHRDGECVRSCGTCQTSRESPPLSPMHSWSWRNKPWSRVHVNYVSSGRCFFYHDKCTFQVEGSSLDNINLISNYHQFDEEDICSMDNTATFTSEEFVQFLRKNGLKCIRMPPYHQVAHWASSPKCSKMEWGSSKMVHWMPNCHVILTYTPNYHWCFTSQVDVWSVFTVSFGYLVSWSQHDRLKSNKCTFGHDVHTKPRDIQVGMLKTRWARISVATRDGGANSWYTVSPEVFIDTMTSCWLGLRSRDDRDCSWKWHVWLCVQIFSSYSQWWYITFHYWGFCRYTGTEQTSHKHQNYP